MVFCDVRESVDINHSGFIEKAVYHVWMRKMLNLLVKDAASMSEDTIHALIEADWARDAKGGNEMNKKAFFNCW